jgi:hypothetical protein
MAYSDHGVQGVGGPVGFESRVMEVISHFLRHVRLGFRGGRGGVRACQRQRRSRQRKL